MPPSSPSESGRRRSSLFGLKNRSPSPLTSMTNRDESTKTPKLHKKKSRFADPWSSFSDLKETIPQSPTLQEEITPTSSRNASAASATVEALPQPPPSGRHSQRPSLSKNPSRPSSIFGSIRSRFTTDDDTIHAVPSTPSMKSPATTSSEFGAKDEAADVPKSRNVLHHGEVQITSKWFKNKKEYMVLTESHLVRFKSLTKAAETFPCLVSAYSRAAIQRHASSRSIDSQNQEHQSFGSDSSGDHDFGIPLRQIVGVHLPEEGQQSSLEIAYLDCESCQGTFLLLVFPNIDARVVWLQALREAANKVRLIDPEPVPQKLLEYAARVVEREEDYSPSAFMIYKVVKRTSSRSSGRVSADDSVKAAPSICLLIVGVHKVHLIQLPKSSLRGSTPSLQDLGDGHSHGILTLTLISVSAREDSFSLAFRSPLQRSRSYELSSLANAEIALTLKARDRWLRPEWTVVPFLYNGPSPFEDDMSLMERQRTVDELCGWTETLTAFCVAYGVSPSIVSYSVEYECEDAPRFVLFPPQTVRRSTYTPLELLAIVRSLRYNESFGTLDFSKVKLDSINGAFDTYGEELLCLFQKTGIPIGIPYEDQARSCLLVSELRALAACNRRLRRIDVSGCLNQSDPTTQMPKLAGSGIFEALYPLCAKQSTNIDWFCVNSIPMQEQDLEYLISLLAQRSSHVRGLELGGCSLTDHSVQLILDTLRTQANTLEALTLSNNINRVMPTSFSRSLDCFEFMRKLDLSNLAVSAVDEPILGVDTLRRWRLEELKLSGTNLNDASVKNVCGYLSHRQSEVLKSLMLADCGLTAAKVADMMEAMATRGSARSLALDVSDNPLTSQGHDRLVAAIARNLAPTHLSMSQYEYEHEENFAELLFALASNRSIRALNLARISLPGAATETAIHAMEELLRENQTLQVLDISGEESRLEATRFGPGLVKALGGLAKNKSLLTLRVEYQKLGLHGAAVLADVIRVNDTLQELHCEHNDISMSGFVDICNAVQVNKTIIYLPSLGEGREAQLKQMESQIREARTKTDRPHLGASAKASTLRKSFGKVGSFDSNQNSKAKKTPPVPQWTSQDEQHAYRMIADGWEEHIQRLELYLDRNRRLVSGEAVDEDDFNVVSLPTTAGSLSNISETVAFESTPTVEKKIDLGSSPRARAEDVLPLQEHAYVVDHTSLAEPKKDPLTVLPGPYIHATSVPSGALAGPTLAPAPVFTTRDGSSSPASQDSDDLIDADRTPVFEHQNPFNAFEIGSLRVSNPSEPPSPSNNRTFDLGMPTSQTKRRASKAAQGTSPPKVLPKH